MHHQHAELPMGGDLVLLFCVSVLGSAHCVAMCGHYVTMCTAQFVPAAATPAARCGLRALFNLGRLGTYGVIDAGSLFGLGLPVITVAILLCAVGLGVGGRRMQRTRYRPDHWGGQEWAILASGAAVVGAMALANALAVSGVSVSFQPLAIPPLPLVPVAGILVAALPALIAPARRSAPSSARTELEAAVA